MVDVPLNSSMDHTKRKQQYSTPRLIVYGDVRTLTRENGPHVLKDGSNNARGNRT
jgi:hypothetical protein